MSLQLGDFPASATIDFKWDSVSLTSGSITRATDGSIRIYKNNSATQRTSSNGITDTEDFDSLTGIHHLRIDLSDNTDAGFYAAGSEYQVVLQGAVIDGLTLNLVLAHFSIERTGGIAAVKAKTDSLTFTVAGTVNANALYLNSSSPALVNLYRHYAGTLTGYTADSGSTTTLTDAALTQGDDYWNGMVVVFPGPSTLAGLARVITDFDAASDTMTFSPALPVAVSTHNYMILPMPLFNDVSLRAALGLAAADLDTQLDAILEDTAEIGTAGAGLTNINLPDQTMNITGDITGNLSGSVGSVTGFTASDVAAIKAKTDNLPSDPADASVIAGRFDTLDTNLATVDTVADAIKAKTDSLTFTVAGQVDSNVQYVNDVQVTGTGATGDEWGP